MTPYHHPDGVDYGGIWAAARTFQFTYTTDVEIGFTTISVEWCVATEGHVATAYHRTFPVMHLPK